MAHVKTLYDKVTGEVSAVLRNSKRSDFDAVDVPPHLGIFDGEVREGEKINIATKKAVKKPTEIISPEMQEVETLRGHILLTGTMAEIDEYINQNITDTASIAAMLKLLTRCIRIK